MRLYLIIIGVLLSGATFSQGLTAELSITSQGTQRFYRLGLPAADVDDNLSVVFVLHGQGGTGQGIAATTSFTQAAIDHNFIAVYPNAIGGVWDKNVFAPDATDDVIFLEALIDKLQADYNINTTKVYATGFSDGAAMVYRLAAESGDKIAAFAPVAGLLQLGGYDWFGAGNYGAAGNPNFNQVPILHIHGMNDNNGATAYPDPNHAPGNWTEYPLYAFSYPTCGTSTYNAAAVTYPYTGVRKMPFCANPEITLIGIEGLGHSWPTLQNSNYNATAEIVRFFGLEAAPTPMVQPSLLKVNGRFLYDDCNQKIILRGVNIGSVYFASSGMDWELSSIPEIAKTGANTVRIVLEKEFIYTWKPNPDNPGGSWIADQILPTGRAQIEPLIQACLANGMIPVLELHDYTGQPSDEGLNGVNGAVAWWSQPDIRDFLLEYQNYLIINIANEPSPSVSVNSAEKLSYYNANKTAILGMRAAGYTCPLMIDGLHWGKDHTVFLDYGAQLLNDDPESNLLFSVHLYWPTPASGAPWWTADDATITNRFNAMYNSGLPFVFGEIASHDVGNGEYAINYPLILEMSQQMEFGWYAWWWRGTWTEEPLNMTNTGLYDDLDGHGLVIARTSPYSIQNTSMRSYKMLNGVCENPSPLDIISFAVTAINCTAQVNWVTVNEENVSHFEIETSIDGITFTTSQTTYANNRAEQNNYQILLSETANQNFYRLKSVDIDGAIKYSNIASVLWSNCGQSVKIWPNPVTHTLNINNAIIGDYYALYTIAGGLITKGQFVGSYHKLDMTKLSAGVYFLVMNGTTQQIVKK